ncbi:c-5 sterol desaturase [Podila minutissima]|uniref:C-5 sterol desaturase n=1 Tax=Podila minutissima TaxID=64525 RepID=A0A9P5SM82_9FUNG|nr:c-5 sterol desaturase [Podila minutissima]
MDVVLDHADHYVLDTLYSHLPAIPIPDLVAGIASLPNITTMQAAIASSSFSIPDTASNFWLAASSSGTTLNSLAQDSILRQTLSLFILTLIGAHVMYFLFASSSYYLVFDQNHTKHPKFLKNQVKLEIEMSLKALPGIAVMTTPWFLGEVRGYSKLYSHIHTADAMAAAAEATKVVFNPPATVIQETMAAAISAGANVVASNVTEEIVAQGLLPEAVANVLGPLAPMVEFFMDGWGYVALSIAAFLFFTDCGIYWVHRFLHHPLVYKRLHKPHHKWIIPTPYSSHAFHPVDGYLQSVPYHVFVFVFPMQKYIYLTMFVLVNFWSVLIHDGEVVVESSVINSAAHHSVHHLYFNYNYGQYFTLWDRLGGSYRTPGAEQYDKSLRMNNKVWKKQAKEVDGFDEFGKPTDAIAEKFKTTGAPRKVVNA